MSTVEQLYREDVGAEDITTVGGGKELRGPCPGCGGNDRFGVFPRQNGGRGSFFCGRFSGSANTGCGKGGDAIEYLRQFRSMSYVDACGYLGIEPKKTKSRSHLRYKLPQSAPKKANHVFVPDAKGHPEEVVDAAKWREHGLKFVTTCHNALLENNIMLAYLQARGISMEVIRSYRLGYHGGQKYNNKQHQPSYRPWPSWGLRDEKNPNTGRNRMIALPAGIVIPSFAGDQLHRITIRMRKPDRNGNKYHYVRGSIRDLWLTDAGTGCFITIEAELDCLAVIAAAGDLIGTVGIGSTGVKPDQRAAVLQDRSTCILGGLDSDKPQKNEKTGRIEMPGPMAGRWWAQTYGERYHRWVVPEGKDPGEAFEAGVNLRLWIQAGLAKYGQQVDVAPAPVAKVATKSAQQTKAPVIEQPETESKVLQLTLSNGKTIYLTNDHESWRELAEQLKPVFTQTELDRLKFATADLDPDQRIAAAMRVIDVKETLGGFVKHGAILEQLPDQEDEHA